MHKIRLVLSSVTEGVYIILYALEGLSVIITLLIFYAICNHTYMQYT